MEYEQTLSLSIIFDAIDKQIKKLRKIAKDATSLELKIQALDNVRQMEKERSNLRMHGHEIEDIITGRK